MKYYIIAGEASGDLHGSNLIKELRKNDPGALVRCWGGDKMAEAGGVTVKHYRDLAFMGFAEVIKNLPAIFRNLSFCKKDISSFQPDVLVLIDYPGFNMRIAKWAHARGLKVAWYISPQIWAWKENRVHAIKRDVDRMMVILPFEKDFYKKHGVEVDYVGHPLAEVISEWEAAHPSVKKENIIALLPGSRQQEIRVKLPIMLNVAAHFPGHQFIVAKAPGLPEDFYEAMLRPYKNVDAVAGKTYDLLAKSCAALVTSGTATLETALFGVPEIICYKGSRVSYEIARRVIKIKFIGLVNLIMDREVVKELIQDKLNVENLKGELQRLLTDEAKKEQIRKDYAALKELLSAGGNASANAAAKIIEMVRS
ncbi:MAG: lipid-A-disaccharide synthase [Ferruginibacter sp.]